MNACRNCCSERRSIYRSGFCRKCYPWELKRKKLKAQIINQLQSEPEKRPTSDLFHMVDAERILEEYRWRESKLQSESLTGADIESVLKAIAMVCRSEFSIFNYSDLDRMNQKDKHIAFEALLDLLENIPCREPILHTFEHPIKGTYQSGWKHELRQHWVEDTYKKRLAELKKELHWDRTPHL